VSIYATWLTIGDDEHEPECAKYRLLGEYPLDKAFTVPGGSMYISAGKLERVYARVPGAACTCSNSAPIIYRGSHVSPSEDDPRGGSVDFAAIPNFCHPSVRGTDTDDGPPVEFARLSVVEDPSTYGHEQAVGSANVILERAQVKRLRDTLTQWLESKDRA
jgi:hypothetical protein